MKLASLCCWTIIGALLFLNANGRSAAGGRSKVAQETAEYVLQRFGRQAAREGAETLARKIEVYASRHGDDFVKAVRQVGPRTFHLVEEAGVNGSRALQVMAKHGEHGATWVVARPKGMQIFLQHGDDAAAVLVKHKAIAEPVIERLGQPAVKALQASNAQSGRRLAMMLENGDLAKIGRNEELLDLVAKHGDRALTLIWEHKGALATTAVLTAFLANPEVFIDGTRDITKTVGENAVKPMIEAPVVVATEVARGTNWTVILMLVGLVSGVSLTAYRFQIGTWFREWFTKAPQARGAMGAIGSRFRAAMQWFLKRLLSV